MEFKRICPKCQGTNVELFSAVQKEMKKRDESYKCVEITFVCNECTHAKSSLHYLYQADN